MKCLDRFDSNDTLYHYTKTTTALEYILYNKQLRLSDRVNSNDPIESLSPSTWIEIKDADNSVLAKIDDFYWDVKDKVSRLKQVCFCMNDTSNRFKNRYDKPYEFYGCMKPRMWEQYADNYNGVCLILSKAELLKQLDKSYKSNAIKYVRYNDLNEKISKIDSRELSDSNYEMYLKKIFHRIDKYIFHKHEDYEGENEYRICSYEALEINIESALKGIVVSENNSQYFKEKLIVYGDKLNILEIKWKSEGVEIDKLEDNLKLRKKNKVINEGIKKRMLNK